eukprot:GCRY01006799.1.p1 GENE.GCRY01006799.1~~GCRY01006799.1.p1  ORF type:complete len:223 (-),score=78.57 GCRY01006799.1:249-917(-)
MGNSLTAIKEHYKSEFERVSEGQLEIVLDALLSIPPSDTFMTDLRHLPILFFLDQERNGRFTLENIHNFIDLIASDKGLMALNSSAEFTSHLRALHILKLQSFLQHPAGENTFSDWFTRLFSENLPLKRFAEYPDTLFLYRDAISTVHDILQVQEVYGVDFQEFFDTVQRSAEEQGLMSETDSQLDDYAPVMILQQFAKDFVGGFNRLLSEFGFCASTLTTA